MYLDNSHLINLSTSFWIGDNVPAVLHAILFQEIQLGSLFNFLSEQEANCLHLATSCS